MANKALIGIALVLVVGAVVVVLKKGPGRMASGNNAIAADISQEDSTGRAASRITKSDEEWRKILDPEVYRITREQGTERAYTGKYWDFYGKGIYLCACCGEQLFSSDTKFESGTGWPSFYQPIGKTHVTEASGMSFGMFGIEVSCSRCGAHLGHVFNDGPPPTGLRYCINSAATKFVGAGQDSAKAN